MDFLHHITFFRERFLNLVRVRGDPEAYIISYFLKFLEI